MTLWSASSIGKRVSLLGVLAVSFWLLTDTHVYGQTAATPAQKNTINTGEAKRKTTSPVVVKSEEYHTLSPEVSGLTVRVTWQEMKVGVEGIVLGGQVSQAAIESDGNLYHIELASNDVTDGKLRSTQYGDILISKASMSGRIEEIKVTDSQLEKIIKSLEKAPAFCEICSASRNGLLLLVKSILKTNPDLAIAKDSGGQTPLHWAVITDHRDVAQLLLAYKADVNATNGAGMTPLHFAILGDGKPDVDLMVKFLLANHAEINAKDQQGNTSLYYATQKGYTALAEILRQHGGHE